MAQPSLSELCSTCYTETPKYRCPRCGTRTCSLPCYKKHQQRASCNGKRDPAAYLKKSELATAASVDRDYNYLKGVERSIDDASTDARERGVSGHHHFRNPQSGAFRREGAFQRYLAENAISVEYAPKGMSREKNNRSRVTKNDKIYWTIEWRDASGEQDIRHDADSSATLGELFRGVLAVRRKRKVALEVDGNGGDRKQKKRRTSHHEVASNESAVPPETNPQITKPEPPRANTASATPSTAARAQEQGFFYLLKPSTTGRSKVVIPLHAETTLTKALQGQTVLEFPTIYVLCEAPDNLPHEFVNATDHPGETGSLLKKQQSTVSANDRSNSAGLPSARNGHDDDEKLDANAILDMLRRDVRT